MKTYELIMQGRAEAERKKKEIAERNNRLRALELEESAGGSIPAHSMTSKKISAPIKPMSPREQLTQ